MNLSTAACTPVYLRLPKDDTSEPQQVAVFKT